MMYSWQEPYLSTLLETDESKLHTHILETKAAFEQRLLSPVGDKELRALGIAAVALDALERKRLKPARRISAIREVRASRGSARPPARRNQDI
jgi:hypothetical protein